MASDEKAKQVPAPAEEPVVEAPPPPLLPLNEDIARILQEQIEIVVQRQVYHTQLLFGVSGMGTAPVNARNAVLTIATAIRNNTPDVVNYTLANLGDPQISQINDHTTPHNFNAQVAGLLEGILVDTVAQELKADPKRQSEARVMLEQLFISANEEIEKHPHSSLAFRLVGSGASPKQLPVG